MNNEDKEIPMVKDDTSLAYSSPIYSSQRSANTTTSRLSTLRHDISEIASKIDDEFLLSQVLRVLSKSEKIDISINREQKHKCAISDEEMDRLFAGRPDFDDSQMPELSKEDFQIMVRNNRNGSDSYGSRYLTGRDPRL